MEPRGDHGPNEVRWPERRKFLAVAPLAAAGLALGACSTSKGGGSVATTTPAGPPTTKAAPTRLAASASDTQWPMYGHDFAATRANLAERHITRATARRLAKAWELDGLVGVTGTPVVVAGIAYFGDWTGAVTAAHAATGTTIWKSQVGGTIVGAPALDDTRVFVSSGATVFALDQATGKQLWSAKTDDHPQAQINASPIVVDGIVLQGTASFENMLNKDTYTFRGSIVGFDAATGKQRWKFRSTPADKTAGAGAGIWSTPAIDPERGMLYVGTGQGLAPPTPPLADSLLAIDYRTGVLRWSRQFTYPDVFSAAHPQGKDADVGASPNLWTSGGRDLVGAGDKGGTYHALDRDTGKVAWNTRLAPGSAFGGEIGSAALVDGLIVASSNIGNPATNSPTDFSHVFGMDPATGKKRWTSAKLAGKIFNPVGAVPGVAFVGTDQGQLLALDSHTGRQLWTTKAPDKVACGPSVVGGRLLWGYGFTLFGPAGKGGVLCFTVDGKAP